MKFNGLACSQEHGEMRSMIDVFIIMFPETSVKAADAHSIRINSEQFQIGANRMRIITDSGVNTALCFV